MGQAGIFKDPSKLNGSWSPELDATQHRPLVSGFRDALTRDHLRSSMPIHTFSLCASFPLCADVCGVRVLAGKACAVVYV